MEQNKEKAEYMRQYRAKQKEAKQLIENRNSKATMLQNAIRNKLARKALLQQIQNWANEVISQINQERQAQPIKRRDRPRKQVYFFL